MSQYVFSLIVAITLFLITFEVLRRGIIQEKFSLVWTGISAVILLMAGFPTLLDFFARLFGVKTPSNLVFFSALIFLFVLNIQVTFELGKLLNRTQRLAEEISLLKLQVIEIEDGDK